MDLEFDEIDFKSISQSRRLLEKFSVDRYWNEFNGDWKAYLTEVFKYDTEDKSVEKPFRLSIPEKPHPFGKWI
jgi:hypothetical protein